MHPGQNLPDKRQNPRQKPPRTIEREFVQGDFVRVFCTRPIKIRGDPRCVTYFFFLWSGDVWQSVTKEVKLAKNSVMYFMDSPKGLYRFRLNNSVKSFARAFAVVCGRKCVICVIWK